jgi:hypothetical protein
MPVEAKAARPAEALAPAPLPPASPAIPTNSALPDEAPKTSLPRLQGIFFHATRPSAIMNGKSVFVGDKVGEFRVTAITRDSATVVGAGQTNILSFGK